MAIIGEFAARFIDSDNPSEFLESCRQTGFIKQLPELYALTGIPQNPQYHPEGDVWEHTKLVCAEAAFLCSLLEIVGDKRSVVILAALCHDFGKPVKTFRLFGRLVSHGHEKAGVKPASRFLDRIGIAGLTKEKILKLVEYHHIPFSFYRAEAQRRERISYRALRKCAPRIEPATMEELLLVAEADFCGRSIEFEYIQYNGQMKKRNLPGEWFVTKMVEKGMGDQLTNHYLYKSLFTK